MSTRRVYQFDFVSKPEADEKAKVVCLTADDDVICTGVEYAKPETDLEKYKRLQAREHQPEPEPQPTKRARRTITTIDEEQAEGTADTNKEKNEGGPVTLDNAPIEEGVMQVHEVHEVEDDESSTFVMPTKLDDKTVSMWSQGKLNVPEKSPKQQGGRVKTVATVIAPAKPATPVKAAAPVEPAAPAEPAASVEPAAPAAPAAPVKPATRGRPAAPVKPAAPAEPEVPVPKAARGNRAARGKQASRGKTGRVRAKGGRQDSPEEQEINPLLNLANVAGAMGQGPEPSPMGQGPEKNVTSLELVETTDEIDMSQQQNTTEVGGVWQDKLDGHDNPDGYSSSGNYFDSDTDGTGGDIAPPEYIADASKSNEVQEADAVAASKSNEVQEADVVAASKSNEVQEADAVVAQVTGAPEYLVGLDTGKTMLELITERDVKADIPAYKWPVAEDSMYMGKKWSETSATSSWSGKYAVTGQVTYRLWDLLTFESFESELSTWFGKDLPPVLVVKSAKNHLRDVVLKNDALRKALETAYDHPITYQEITNEEIDVETEHPAVLFGLTTVAHILHEGMCKKWGVRIWKQNKETKELECPKSVLTRVQSQPESKITNRGLVVDFLALYNEEDKGWCYTPLKFLKE